MPCSIHPLKPCPAKSDLNIQVKMNQLLMSTHRSCICCSKSPVAMLSVVLNLSRLTPWTNELARIGLWVPWTKQGCKQTHPKHSKSYKHVGKSGTHFFLRSFRAFSRSFRAFSRSFRTKALAHKMHKSTENMLFSPVFIISASSMAKSGPEVPIKVMHTLMPWIWNLCMGMIPKIIPDL